MKKRLFIGLASLFAFLTATAISASSTMFYYSGYINAALGITRGINAAEEDSMVYKSKYGDLNKENCEKLIADEIAHSVKTMEEGAVLLKNKDNALPLKSEERNITLFGNNVKNPVYRTNAGQASYSDKYGGSLIDAFEGGGFELNKTLIEAYQNSNVNRVSSSKIGQSSIGEVDISFYTDTLKNSYSEKYHDAAIVLLTRFAGEGVDLDPIGDKDGLPSLALHQQEKDLLKMIKESGKFNKTIVLINSPFAMDAKWLEDEEYGVDAAICFGAAGNCGFIGIVNLLKGDADFSGHLSDTWATSSLSSPAMQNFGNFTFTNLNNNYNKSYVVYQEGIYVGYRYYETRYQDQILNQNNATSSSGAFASSNWDYAKEMAYTFGYGLSYSDFTQELTSLSWDKTNKQLTAVVKVTNNGSSFYNGKSSTVVQLYGQLPFNNETTEKSAIQLVGYGRSNELAKGESETVNIVIDDYHFATYDQNATNGYDSTKKGCYVFDKGDYYFAIGKDSHDALNNILTKRGISGLFDQNGNSVIGNANNVELVTLDALDNVTYAVNPITGKPVYNQMDNADINYYEGQDIQYLSRKDWLTFPAALSNLTATAEMINDLKGEYYTQDTSIVISDVKYNQDSGLKLIDMKNVEYDDPKWQSFVEQLSVADLCSIIGDDRGSEAIDKIGKPGNSVTNGPSGVAGTYAAGNNNPCMLYPDEVVLCNTFDDELAVQRGEYFAEDMLYAFISWIFGPGNNTHRTPYCGRNSEYTSEDPLIAYNISRKMCSIMSKKGIITGCKHLAFNDQETNRHGVSTFLNEQAAREIYLKSFEGALSDGGGLGVMSSFNRIGCIASPSYAPLQKNILRDEWGFKGINITDSAKDASSYFKLRECLSAGTDLFLSDTLRRSELSKSISSNKDGGLIKIAQECNKHFYYALSRSTTLNGLTNDMVLKNEKPWWEIAIVSVSISFGTLTVVSLGLGIFFNIKGGNKND